jgi:hypothetical protein
MYDTLSMLFVELMTGTVLLDVIGTLEASSVASESHNADGIKSRKLVIVVRNQACRLRQQTPSFGHFLKAGRGSSRPAVRLGRSQLVSYGKSSHTISSW